MQSKARPNRYVQFKTKMLQLIYKRIIILKERKTSYILI